jgi:RNA polymerase sigma-70 factor (ECF subfamily)
MIKDQVPLRFEGGSGVLQGRFRRATATTDAPADGRTTARAVARAKLGDREAQRYLYIRYADNVFGYVWSIVHDEHDAEDVTQQVFVKLLRILPKYQECGSPFLAWVLRVARNVAVDEMRQRRPLPCEEVGDSEDKPHPHDPCEAITLREAIASLPEDQREVVLLRHVIGMSPGEIASHLGRSEPSVHGLHHRGRGALRAELLRLNAAPAVRAS